MPDEQPPPDRRRPRRVYRVGTEPDPRFTLANERTFLAWIRTSLALVAAGVALEAFAADFGPGGVRRVVAGALVLLGLLASASAYRRWAAGERALRTGRPLPAPGLAVVLAYGLGAVALVALVLLFAGS